MAPKITENNIDKMLESYYQCDKELEEIMKTLDAQNVRALSCYVHNYWIKRQRTNILQRFHCIEARRNKLRTDIHLYYMDELEKKSDEKCRTIAASESIDSEKTISPKSSMRTNLGDLSLSCNRPARSGKPMPKFARLLQNMKIRFNRDN